MDQFNKNVYKKQGLFDEFSSSCLGKLVIMGVIIIGLCVLAIISVPTEEQMFNEAEDNIRECIQDNNENCRRDCVEHRAQLFCSRLHPRQ